MASSVFYKFKSQRTESRVTFDGTGISVFDLKKEVILANNLGKANDFDLHVYDPSSGDEFKDDSHIIPRSSSVIVKRLPSAKPGKGKAAMYLAGTASASTPVSDTLGRSSGPVNGFTSWHKGAITKRFDGKEEEKEKPSAPPPKSTAVTVKSAVAQDDEAAAMAAMFQAQTQNWEETQEKMSHATRIYTNSRGTGLSRGGKPHLPSHQPDRPLPPSYVCYRCGQKGHWIQDCPTNNDRDFDNKPRIKRSTGIPRSFLKTVDNPLAAGSLGHGVMVTPEGGYVIAQPDVASWQKQVAQRKTLTEVEVRERTPTDASLICPIDNKLFRDAVKTPCCGTSYCEECIQSILLERDFACPSCGKRIPSLDKVAMDKPTRTKVADYIDKAIEDSKKEGVDEPEGNIADISGEQSLQAAEAAAIDQELYAQPPSDMDMSQMIEQLQAQIKQISVMLNNPSLPKDVRGQTQMKHQQLQLQLQQAQTFAAALAAATSYSQQAQTVGSGGSGGGNGVGYGMGGYQQQGDYSAQWGGMYQGQQQMQQQHHQHQQQQQQLPQDSAYQRLPVNARRRNLKRDRPSDFLEVAGSEGQDNKIPRFWE
ncbi:hypothetical protein JAAARDRAFT_31201 [Jaapia argillacea MUCL 33604]|uniref:DWNN-domain-containing protein n=1 Tax=Jaapia argillacea MUCL 33604 TaxID=933084 RepID=A0A067Q3U5_9AGAM|nr:hypothetical protein JAAARDRAFT_31201 [Jaapia argillacea MUCL 33604]